jgi:tRNA (mo5U34)-methyltransferase
MRRTAPDGFDISSFFTGIYTFQSWEIFPGYRTNGPKDVASTLQHLRFPDRLEGQRILDIGPWNGFFSFECARRGATEVFSFGPDDPDATGYNRVRDLLEVENCRYQRGSVYDVSLADQGMFDIVLFLGLIYHLRHPLLALDCIHEVAQGTLYVDSPIIDGTVYDRTVDSKTRRRMLRFGKEFHELPLSYFTKGEETGDAYNWFIPNRRAFRAFVESAGFEVNHFGDDGGVWAWLSATKAQRAFTPKLEGFNQGAACFGQNN